MNFQNVPIVFQNDQTFEFNYQFDLSSAWAIGTWSRIGDTIILEVTPVFDTLIRTNQPDTLVLSLDKQSQRISSEQFAIYQMTSREQLPTYVPNKFVFRNGRLYKLDNNGKLVKKKVKRISSKRKFPTWYRHVNK